MTSSNAVAAGETCIARASGDAFLIDCRIGLRHPQRTIPSKWLYDEEGSRLFQQICSTPEYYPSRVESALLKAAAPAIEQYLAPDTALVEFGSGASQKTRLLLDVVDAITSYVPIDINPIELARATKAIAEDYPWLETFPILGDFTAELDLGPALMFTERLGFFPGSTLGNFAPDDAISFLRKARDLLGAGSRLLLGVDLAKDIDTLLAAYDDRAGVTAAFNLNLLARMNRELAAGIDLDAFEHRAVWDAAHARIEMHLVCTRDQHIRLGGERFDIKAGETIHTENSRKFSMHELSGMFAASEWSVATQWVSGEPSYALILLRC